jgi:uncharacterized membrane protein
VTDTTWAPRGLTWTSFVLAIAGLGVSIYLTIEHYSGSNSLACPDTGRINCLKVTTSSYSEVAGIPVALLGLLFYVAAIALMAPPVWNAPVPLIRWVRLAAVVVGIVFVAYLVWAELYRVHAICLWCTSVHVLTFLLLAVTLYTEAYRPAD